ncbi:MAG TPA: outer membrane beta-barrel family protein [Segetibacter sp.]|jgi:outer membrane receptor protein involved in Fe transport
MRKELFTFLALLLCVTVFAQPPGGGRPGGAGGNMTGHFYGKVVDSKSGKGVDGATLQLVGGRMDTATRKATQQVLRTVISEANGDFSIERVPVMGNFELKISAVGFKSISQKVSFASRPGGMSADMLDKDLGNIKIEADPSDLGTVTVTSTRRLFEMGVDRKIFNVDKNLTSAGQTATEIMKSIPSLSVDIDGNVTLRNATPQLFVDGRPTTLTMDQIPADIIESVELITNPSAKFDASGGNAGILNIVLKKNKKVGYNGSLRTGTDTRGGFQLGGDINVRQNKINFFGGANLFRRRSISESTTDRTTLLPTLSRLYQTSNPINKNLFGFGRGGFDYFIDNRNTISVTASLSKGNADTEDFQRNNIDSIKNPSESIYQLIKLNSDASFRRIGSQLSFKHNFAKNGHTLTADANFNQGKNESISIINTNTYRLDNTRKNRPDYQKSEGFGNTNNFVFQTDYSNPISEKQKFEAGLRASINDVATSNNQSLYDYDSVRYINSKRISSNFTYLDKVYAAYSTYSIKVNNWSYQLGLRAESSVYNGRDERTDSSFEVKLPLSLFPSVFVTHKLSDKEDVQINFSRRINRPNFFQLLPFYDYSDVQNVSIGNPGLKPEFTQSFEVSYNNSYARGANFLVSAFGKYNTNLITRFQFYAANPDVERKFSKLDSVILNTFVNANSSVTYGLELTNRMPVTKWWDGTVNFNLFNSTINLQDPTGKNPDVKNQRTSWFVKMNNSFKLPKAYSLQFSGDYYARTVLPNEGGRGGGGGGRGGGGPMMFGGGGPSATAQGFINPRYSFDMGLRKDFTWKGGTSASLTLSMNDIFRTQLFSTYSESPFFKQISERRRDPQILRLNLNYRFGKFDPNLFKRRNDRAVDGGVDIAQ